MTIDSRQRWFASLIAVKANFVSSEFFKGWQRKLGVVVLFFSCVVLAAWVRSRLEHDFIQWQTRNSVISMKSYDGMLDLRWTSTASPATTPLRQRSNYFTWRSMELSEYYEAISYRRWNWGGFQFTLSQSSIETIRQLIIPYWMIVCPLTLFSTYLILAKLQSKKLDASDP